jgi:hypothetical protein
MCCAVCWPTIIIILAGLALTGYFMYPKMPTLYIGEPFVPADSKGLTYSPPASSIVAAFSNASVATPFTLTLDYAVNVTVHSENNFDIAVSALQLNVLQVTRANS